MSLSKNYNQKKKMKMKNIFIILVATIGLILNPMFTSAQQSLDKAKSEDVSVQKKEDIKKVQKKPDAGMQADQKVKKEVNKSGSNAKKQPQSANEVKTKTVKIGSDQEVTVDQKKVNKKAKDVTNATKKEYQKGHASGKNKGEVEGRKYGQSKSAEAKRRIESSQAEIKSSSSRLKQAEGKIAYARKKTQEAYDEKRISEEEYKAKMTKLDAYEKQISELEAENKGVSKEINNKIEEKDKSLEEAYKQKKITEEEYKAKKKDLDDFKIDNKDAIKVTPTPLPPEKEKK